MGMVAPQQRIASAYFVFFGNYGDVTRYAQERGVCRQWVYREATALQQALAAQHQTIEQLQARVRELEQQHTDLQERLRLAVVLDAEKQAQFASVGQACGVSLPVCWELLDVLIPGQQQSVATLGRGTQAAGKRAGELLAIVDAWAQERVREVAADEIYVKAAVLMTVEPESLCWLGGRLSAEVSGAAWAQEFGQLPNLEQVTRDGGTGLAKGVELVNAQRQAQGQAAVVDQGDHFHALRDGGVGLRKAEMQARKALAAAEAAEKELAQCHRQGQKRCGPTVRARVAWQKAEQAMDTWSQREQLWQQTKEALLLFTPSGELNTREQATAVLAETLPQLPDGDFAKAKRSLQKAEMLHYLDRVQQQIESLPFSAEVKQAAVRQEGLRRRPELLQGESAQAAARRGVMLLCAVVLGQAGELGQQAATAVRDVLRRAYRASSLVECINSVLRMQQARHRKMTQGLLDLKRLYWNCHTFRTGRRRNTTPYGRLGVPWPEGLRWWDLLKMTPEQLRDKLSTAKKPP
jgi:cell division protein FtsB